jgi:hypothetical protein
MKIKMAVVIGALLVAGVWWLASGQPGSSGTAQAADHPPTPQFIVGSCTVLPEGEPLSVTELQTFSDDGQTRQVRVDIGDSSETLKTLTFLEDPETGYLFPTGLSLESESVATFGTPKGITVLDKAWGDMAGVNPEDLTPEQAAALLAFPLGAGLLSDLGLPPAGSFDAITVVAQFVPPPPSEPYARGHAGVCMIFWNSGQLAGVRMAAGRPGPYWPWCCYIFEAFCGSWWCPGSFADCIDGGYKPCHTYDHCCLIAYILSHVF